LGREFLKISTALKKAWTTVEQYSDVIDSSPYEDLQLYCRQLERRIAERERRLGSQNFMDGIVVEGSIAAEAH